MVGPWQDLQVVLLEVMFLPQSMMDPPQAKQLAGLLFTKFCARSCPNLSLLIEAIVLCFSLIGPLVCVSGVGR